ncbi:MAG: type I methionyl aminopeptidase [Candidatus Moranbacteria bacterium]|nr:type I methionyl aminopeptidase [Candidatus Moranbacteria bacterium]
MVPIKTPEELAKMRQGGRILRQILNYLQAKTQPGVSRKQINKLAGRLIKSKNAKPSFLNYQDYPANLCIFTNQEVEHGLPGNKIIQDGDLVTYDLGIYYLGLHTDASVSFICGQPSPEKQAIIKVCQECLQQGIKQARVGRRVGDIGAAIQKHAEKNGYSVVRQLIGHGVGKEIHEPPNIPNYGQTGTGEKLKKGMCLAIEPMINQGGHEIKLLKDGWTYVTKDGKLSCHFEHTVAVAKKRAQILTKI